MNRLLRHLFVAFLVAAPFSAACNCDEGALVDQDDVGSMDAGDEDDVGDDEDACPEGEHPDGMGGCTADVCVPNPCDSDERCVAEDGLSVCECPAGTTEIGDECVEDQECGPDTCDGHGTCDDSDGSPVCTCDTGHTGQFCGECDTANGWFEDDNAGCTDDLCAGHDCPADRVCEVVDSTATCVCGPGTHEADNGMCVTDTTCQSDSCNGHGTCDDSSGAVKCTCDAGWTGQNCDACDDQAGYHDDGMGGCTTDPCLPNPCTDANKSQCQADQDGSTTCSCDPGYHEESGTCVADETCASNSCSGHGTCDDTGGVIDCACDAGYVGADCSSCDTANGYHDDGMGGCTTDPCLPNPCTDPNKTTCVSNGTSYICECDSGYHPDGMGGCTDDPCLPDTCAAMNMACRVVNGMKECYTPDCDDQNPCTDDALVNGQCQHTMVSDGSPCSTDVCTTGETCQNGTCGGGSAVDCDDNNPCTADICDPGSGGCVNTNDDSLVPDDGIYCTTDTCQDGFESHTPDDSACDDQLWCNGAETCAPNDANADMDGCIAGDPPEPPGPSYPCAYYETCDEQTDSFPYVTLSAGDACDDGIACTTGDVCDSSGGCLGTVTGDCGAPDGACTSTTNFANNIDIPVSELTVGLTLDGQPLPSVNEDSNGDNFYPYWANIYAVSKDTDAWHELAYFSYDSFGDLYGPTHIEKLIPGAYDILFRKGWGSDDNIVDDMDDGDAIPNGLRYLERDVIIGGGPQSLSLDITTSVLTVNLTLDGQSLPAVNEDSNGDNYYPYWANIYAVSKDTGAWHELAYFSYDSFGDLNGPTHVEKLIPGDYDILFRKGWGSDDNIVDDVDDGDAIPNGLRYLQRDVTISAGSQTLDIDIPTGDLTVDITLDGQPLPAVNEDSNGDNFYPYWANIYAVSKDTGAWHELAYFSYDSFGDLNGPTHVEQLVPGTYDILFRKGWGSDDNIVDDMDDGDAIPNGLRYLKTGLVISPGSNTVDIDIPTSDLTVDVTLDGQSLPAVNEDSNGDNFYPYWANIYAVSKDTGAWHELAYFSYDSFGDLNGPTHIEKLIPGDYDILFRKGWGSDDNIVDDMDDGDAIPNGLRYLARDVTIAAGSDSLSIDIPTSTLTVNITLNGQSLPAVNEDSNGDNFYPYWANIYAISQDTEAWHELAYFSYDSFGDLNGPTQIEKLVPGTYDILFRKGWGSDDNIVDDMDDGDAIPNGLRYLATDVTIPAGSATVDVDIPAATLVTDINLNGAPLPSVNEDSNGDNFYPYWANIYAVADGTDAWHELAYFSYDSFGDLNGPTHIEKLVPGTYHVLFRKGWGSDDNIVDDMDDGDAIPNGLRYLDVCVDMP